MGCSFDRARGGREALHRPGETRVRNTLNTDQGGVAATEQAEGNH